MVSTPSPPDPKVTASAQTGTNVNTAIANAAMANTNQLTPDGSLTYDITGHTHMTDQEGNRYRIPTYTATQALSPENQKIYDQSEATKLGLATLGNKETGRIADLLGTNIDLSAKNIDKFSNDHWMPGFNRQWNTDQQHLDQKLADQGIAPGSAAYANASHDFSANKQSALDQYLGSMYQNSQNAILQERNQPINEISSLMSGSQVGQPNYVNTPTTQMPTVDYAGLVQQNYQDKLSAANATNSGLFGLGSALLGGWAQNGFKFSDRALKSNITMIAEMPSGLDVYAYDYIWGEPSVGVMADEAEILFPDAVATGPGGFKMVDYARIG
jgi:hypothetical protein